MKRIAGIALVACLIVPGTMQGAEKSKLTTEKDKLSYSMGMDMGTYLNSIGAELNYDRLVDGLKTGFEGGKGILSTEEMQAVQQNFAVKMKAKQEAEMLAMQKANKEAGDAFLAKNKEKKGVTVTESGLQYEVISKGKGKKPKATDTVSVHYKGTTIDGTVFDDSSKRGEPAVFGVDQVIPGWSEALQLMREGDKYKVVIPSSLAYGERGVPPMIEPNSVLVFDVELIAVVQEKKPETDKK